EVRHRCGASSCPLEDVPGSAGGPLLASSYDSRTAQPIGRPPPAAVARRALYPASALWLVAPRFGPVDGLAIAKQVTYARCTGVTVALFPRPKLIRFGRTTIRPQQLD